MKNENYKDVERRYEELKERLLPDAICREEDNPNLVTVYMNPKNMFSRKKRKDIEFAIKIASEGRLHAF